jgi:hypothetical protein
VGLVEAHSLDRIQDIARSFVWHIGPRIRADVWEGDLRRATRIEIDPESYPSSFSFKVCLEANIFDAFNMEDISSFVGSSVSLRSKSWNLKS